MNDRPIVTVLSDADDSPFPGLEPLAERAEVRHVVDGHDLEQALPESDVLVVTDFRTRILRRAFPGAKRLKWVHATSAGIDALLFPELVESEMPVTNARGVFDRPIAEYVLGLILMFAKDIAGSLKLKGDHLWEHRDLEPIEGRRVLIAGAGGIGRHIARLVKAVGMAPYGIARRAREEDDDFIAVYASGDMQRVLPEADFVVAAAPLTAETRGLFDTGAFAAMKREARFINIGRGALVRTDALVSALERGQIAGAALDVFEEEPLPEDHPLWSMPNTFISAHMAGDIIGWREALSRQFLDNFDRWMQGEPLHNVVDKHRGYIPSE